MKSSEEKIFCVSAALVLITIYTIRQPCVIQCVINVFLRSQRLNTNFLHSIIYFLFSSPTCFSLT